MWDIVIDSLRNAILVTGLVVIMMMMIECLNIESKGGFFSGLRRSRVGGVLCGALLGAVPGCMGGFAVVSLYTHGLISFGALVAMMIATAGDESFVMLAMMPEQAMWIFALLFCLAVITGVSVDLFRKKKEVKTRCDEHFEIHEADCCEHTHEEHEHSEEHRHGRHMSWKRVLMFVGIGMFIAALATGRLEHEGEKEHAGGINLLSEEWMNIMFAVLSAVVLGVLVWASDHFVEEHLWRHIIVKHLPSVFCWTFGVLLGLGILMHFVDISAWISDNTALMILLAVAIGIIPESGPHLIFVTLFVSGIIPLPVLLASSISQDGHAGLPLLAESKLSFINAKLINCAVALLVGFGSMLFSCSC